jgi:hypothetical protein
MPPVWETVEVGAVRLWMGNRVGGQRMVWMGADKVGRHVLSNCASDQPHRTDQERVLERTTSTRAFFSNWVKQNVVKAVRPRQGWHK